MQKNLRITILGAGIAGLAAGYYARKYAAKFTLYEKRAGVGGNCITFNYSESCYDSGAHRFHDVFPSVTNELKSLLGDGFKIIKAPSKLYHKGSFIGFPISIYGLCSELNVATLIRAGVDLARARMKKKKGYDTFEELALDRYGKTIASLFLFSYSKKLWANDSSKLSPNVAGNRLDGLKIKNLFSFLARWQKEKTGVCEGPFYYPKEGIGIISQRLADACSWENIKTECRVTKIFRNNNAIKAVEINYNTTIEIDKLVSTIPLNLFIAMIDPPPPEEILTISHNIKYRDILLVAIHLNKKQVTSDATLYFPQPDIPFTRIYEPKNRSSLMSPPGRTSLVAEIPIAPQDDIIREGEDGLIKLVGACMERIGLIRESDILAGSINRITYAYPLLWLDVEKDVKKVREYLSLFKNLKLTGRSAEFKYIHLHNLIKQGEEVIKEILIPA